MTAIFQPANERERAFLAGTQKTVGPEDHAKSANFVGGSPSANWVTPGWGLSSSYAYLYRRQPAVRRVVDFLSRNIGQLNLKVYLRADDDDRVEVDNHPLAQLLRNPNPNTSRYRFMRDTVADKAIYDLAYWRLDRPRFPRGLVRIPPEDMVRYIENGKTVYRGPDGKTIPRNELIVFSGYSPEGAFDNEDGVSPLETLRRVLAEESASQIHRENFWRNSARQAGVILRPSDAPEWSDPARQRFRSEWQNTMTGGANAGKTAILEDGMQWNPDSFSPKDSEYIAGRELTDREVCMQYGVAPNLLGMGETTMGNIDSFHRQLYQDTFGPWLKDFQDDIELQLLPAVDTSGPQTRGRTYTEFNLAAKLAGSFEEQMRTLTTAVGVPFLAINEARAKVNVHRVPEGPNVEPNDVPVKPMNVMYGNQPAVTIPTEVPQPKRRARKASVPPAVLTRREDAAKTHTNLFRSYFRAQKQAVTKKAAGFDMERWNLRLTGELYAARVALARKTGKLAARQIDGVYDEAQTLNFLQESARREAVAVNAYTAAALDAADDVNLVFDVATGSRAERLGLSTATAIIGFARQEAAKQSQAADGRARTKTWVVTSRKSRHPELDGETVGIDEDFSNGLPWPGAGNADESAGCQCLLDLS